MNKLLIFLVISILFHTTSYSQNCLPQGAIFSTQEEIDDFQSDYPGCTLIEGNVEINGADINNLNGLEVLTTIEGDLMIGKWSCSVYTNPLLTTLTGLDNITAIGGHLLVYFNNVLSDLNGLNSVNSIGGALYIENNQALNSLSGLESLNSIGSTFTRGFSIKNNNVLINLNGLEQLTSLQGFLRINNNDMLSNISGLENLMSINGDFRIENNMALSQCEVISVCDYLLSPTGNVEIVNNAAGCNNPQEVADACGIIISVEEIESGLNLYPNPTINELFIFNKNKLIITEINIYNQIGQNVLHQNGVNNSIDVSMLQSGVYILELVSGNSKVRKKLIIE